MSENDDTNADEGVILEAANGPLITYDPSGLTLRLSDRVLRDIALRLGGEDSAFGLDPSVLLRGVDAWDVFREGSFLGFHARLPQAGAGWRFMRHADGGAIFARSHGAVLGVFAFSAGQREPAAGAGLRHPYHVLRRPLPEARDRHFLRAIRRAGPSALTADHLAEARFAAHAPMRLHLVQDRAAPAGADYGDWLREAFTAEAARLAEVARELGQPAQVLAVSIDLAGDVPVLLADLARIAGQADLGCPRFTAVFDTGRYWARGGADFAAQARLVWRHGPQDLAVVAPSCIFAQDELGQLSPEGAALRACYEGHAVADRAWSAPALAFAERDGAQIRATFRASGPLVIDDAPPFARAPHAGFRLHDADGAPLDTLRAARPDPDDPRAIIVEGEGAMLSYGWPDGAHAQSGGHYWQHGGALREAAPFADDPRFGPLHRWALPALQRIR